MRAFYVALALALPVLAEDRFYQFAVEQDRLTGAADFSFLNRPLTAADRLFVRDGHFHRVGRDQKPNTADDERVRLFGVNLCFGANFPAEADAGRIARRLRKLGVNLVRLHHMDSSPDRDPKEARSLLTDGPYPTLNPVSVARLRALLDACRAEGIYVNVNLHVGYVFRPAVDDVPAPPAGQSIPTQSKPLHIFHPRMIQLQAEYARKVIGALQLKGDPVLGMVEIDNESSLVEAHQRGNLERAAQGEYQAELERQWQAFLRARYGEGAAPKNADDYWLFLVDRDRYYLRRILEAVRAAADALVPVAGTQMGYGGLLNLDSQQDLDYQDNHFYIDHYNFPNLRWDARDWRIRDTSSVGTGLTTFLNMAAARQAGKPYTLSEFNQPWPNRQAAEIDPTLAAFGAFQDWDSIMHFAYEHGRSWDQRVPSGFNINGDWGKFPNVGQSAWLFRTGAIQAGREPVTIAAPLAARLQAAREKRIGNVAAALTASLGYQPEVALVHPVGVQAAEGKPAPEAAKGPVASPFRSDTGELTYDQDQRRFLLAAPTAAGVFGFLGTGQKATAGALEVELAPGSRGFVTALLTALDGRPLKDSRRMLLTIPGYTLGTQPGSDPPRMQRLLPYPGARDWWTLEPEAGSGKPSGNRNGGSPPVWMERVECVVTLRSALNRLAVHPLDGTGERQKALSGAVTRIQGGFRIHLQADGQPLAPWYELVRP
jgi:hypothetical protein